MSDGRTSANSSLLGFPVPVSLAVFVALLGFIGLRVPTLKSTNPKDDSATPAEAAVAGSNYDGHSPAIKVLAEAFGMRDTKTDDPLRSPGQPAASDPAPPTNYGQELAQFLSSESIEHADLPTPSRCVIACLPDPNDSHFPMSFDNGLESIVRAFNKHGYVRDRYEMVWQNDLRLIRSGAQKSEVRIAHDRASAILFRRASKEKDSPAEFAMLLLVGETPTTGVHPRALHDAMDFVHALKAFHAERAKLNRKCAPAPAPSSTNPDFRVLGPTYSGSSGDLRRAIDQWKPKQSIVAHEDCGHEWAIWWSWLIRSGCFCEAGFCKQPNAKIYARVISGSATSGNNREIFKNSEPRKQLEICYSATVATDDVILQEVIRDFTENRGVKHFQIAILSETDTGYGQNLVKDSSSPSDAKAEQIRHFRYPMTLSRMRNEYSRRGILNDPASSQPEALRRRNLDLSLDVSPYSTDILPSFSPSSAAVAELVLESAFNAILKEDVRVLGILGTDVSDKLFLAQQIRKRCPDVQLFTLESDFLFTHATYAPSLRGMIVASSYPLYPRTQPWSLVTEPDEEKPIARNGTQFASDMSQGVYNAAIQLLNSADRDDPTNQPRLDFGRIFRADISDDSLGANDPPYGWLTMVGDTELLPLRQFGNYDIAPTVSMNSQYGIQHWVRTPPRLAMGLAIVSAISLGLIFAIWNLGELGNGKSISSAVEEGRSPAETGFGAPATGDRQVIHLPFLAVIRQSFQNRARGPGQQATEWLRSNAALRWLADKAMAIREWTREWCQNCAERCGIAVTLQSGIKPANESPQIALESNRTLSWPSNFFHGTRLLRLGISHPDCRDVFWRGLNATTFYLGIVTILLAVSYAPLIHLIAFGLAEDFNEVTKHWSWSVLLNNWIVFICWPVAFSLLLSCICLALPRPECLGQIALFSPRLIKKSLLSIRKRVHFNRHPSQPKIATQADKLCLSPDRYIPIPITYVSIAALLIVTFITWIITYLILTPMAPGWLLPQLASFFAPQTWLAILVAFFLTLLIWCWPKIEWILLGGSSETHPPHNPQVQLRTRYITRPLLAAVFFLAVIIVVLVFGRSLFIRHGDTSLFMGHKAWFAIQISRTGYLGNLVNPAVPILLLGGILSIWGFCGLRRLQLVDDYGLIKPFASAKNANSTTSKADAGWDPIIGYNDLLRRIRNACDEITNSIRALFFKDFRFTDFVAGALIAIALHRALFSRWVGTYEGRIYDWVVTVLLLLAIWLIATFIFRIHKLLRSTDGMLRRVGHLPLAEAFSQLPPAVKQRTAGQLSCPRPDRGDVEDMLRKYKILGDSELGLGFTEAARGLLEKRNELLKDETGSETVFAEIRLAKDLAESSSQLLVPKLVEHWASCYGTQQAKCKAGAPLSDEVKGTGEPSPAQAGEQPVPTDPRTDAWWRKGEELIAIQVTYQIRVIFLHLRNLLVGTTLMILLLFWAVNCYPFQPATLLNFICLVLLVWLLLIVFGGILRFNRNEVLSRINGTTPNQLTFDSSFWAPIVGYIGLPILAVLATMMPTVGRTLFGWTATFGQMFSAGGN